MSNASLYKILNANNCITAEAIAKAWACTMGSMNDNGSFSNCDNWSYFEAVLPDGEKVRCKYIRNCAATIEQSQHMKASEHTLGVPALPEDWTEIRLVNWSHNSKHPHPEGITVARRLSDGGAQIYKTHY